MTEPARPLSVRKQDTLYRLEHDVDLWVATVSADGAPYLMPLSFLWDGKTLLLSTARNNPTARNLRANSAVQLTLGHTRDVVHIAGTSETMRSQDLPHSEAEAFAAKAGFDPRRSAYPYFRITPTKIQSWREVDELSNRVLMQDGTWLV
ncbi:pyridoxamine 5'-phosphate oxidase family protein [Kribbella turkmenica]|uniref:Pyridoxamine 5'-phosphate oxidase family protein n=1 Tax=Kribbella turkmenica TaxID=2530375 RepID=A0A4R4WAG9_9ACTN|nr:pyridoxamine 5'-phosphate oxidase family protein [Kribbella turkmenica]TDD15769.1 pyridoxamine 5'-phosphate oxidase family protein [Kribbella turkmenica]